MTCEIQWKKLTGQENLRVALEVTLNALQAMDLCEGVSEVMHSDKLTKRAPPILEPLNLQPLFHNVKWMDDRFGRGSGKEAAYQALEWP